MKSLSTLLITVTLIVGLVGCGGVARYALTISSTAGGSVTTPGVGTFTYDGITVVKLVAEAEEGYRFENWSGDVESIDDVDAASTTVTMNDNYSITANFREDEVVTFIDPNLEAAVREAIAKPENPIYTLDMEQLGSIDAEQRDISDLTGLEYATHLIQLDLDYNQISDISPLADLTNLTYLDIRDNQISNISPLTNLTNLTDLILGGNQISDISPLENLTSLTSLDLGDNQISDISPLENLTTLTWLSLGDHPIENLSPLANLTNLTGLNLGGSQISDISPLANLTNLTWLFLCENWIGDISPLTSLTNLTGLDLGYNKLSDISALADMTGLTELWLDYDQISDVSPLSNITSLARLSLWGNQISSLAPLANLTNLTELNLGCNQISDLSPLANLTGLRDLYLHDNRISDMSPLANLTNLTWLSLWGNEIGDLAPLVSLINLTGLELGGNQISNISPLVENEGLSERDYVDLRWNALSSDSINIFIPQLEARGVKFNPEFPLVEASPCLLDTEWIKNPATGNYYALTSPMSWMAAEACAQAWGAHLVTLNSWEEELWISDVFGRDEEFWIGFNVIGREHHKDNFAWSSGEPVIYTNWCPGEPNDIRGEDCVHMNVEDCWNDLSRHPHLRGVVEADEVQG